MGSESASGEGFKVQDRRGRSAGAERSDSPQAESRQAGAAAWSGPADLPAEPDLASLILLLAHSALFHLGEGPGAAGPSAPVDLAQAKFSIDLLRLLKGKTEGNRTPEETRLLEGVLYDLQLRFVEATSRR